MQNAKKRVRSSLLSKLSRPHFNRQLRVHVSLTQQNKKKLAVRILHASDPSILTLDRLPDSARYGCSVLLPFSSPLFRLMSHLLSICASYVVFLPTFFSHTSPSPRAIPECSVLSHPTMSVSPLKEATCRGVMSFFPVWLRSPLAAMKLFTPATSLRSTASMTSTPSYKHT